LKMALPAARLTTGWASVGAPPLIDRLAKAARRNEPLADNFSGPSLDTGRPPLGQVSYEPSPYSDYNGAGLLYFASYVTISDTAERQLVRSLGLAPLSPDWALSTSAVRRDVFYYCNLALGDSITAELLAFDREPHAVTTRVRLRRGSSGERMADVVTRRLILDQPR
jgi:probable biosynthetic protein (TIGR04098 family)